MKPVNLAMVVLGSVILVATICYTILVAIGAQSDNADHVLLGFVSAVTGGYLIFVGKNGKEK